MFQNPKGASPVTFITYMSILKGELSPLYSGGRPWARLLCAIPEDSVGSQARSAGKGCQGALSLPVSLTPVPTLVSRNKMVKSGWKRRKANKKFKEKINPISFKVRLSYCQVESLKPSRCDQLGEGEIQDAEISGPWMTGSPCERRGQDLLLDVQQSSAVARPLCSQAGAGWCEGKDKPSQHAAS